MRIRSTFLHAHTGGNRFGVRGLIIATALVVPLPWFTTPAHSLPVPLSPVDSHVAEQWHNPHIRGADAAAEVQVDVTSIGSTTWDGRSPVTLGLRISNHSRDTAHNVTVTVLRAERSPTVAHSSIMMTVGDNAFPHTMGYRDNITVPAGGYKDVVLSTDRLAQKVDPGVYPFLVKVAATTTSGTNTNTERFLLSTNPSPEDDPVGFSMVLPVTARTALIAGETGEAPQRAPLILRDDSVARQLVSGGRLDKLLDSYREILATDPELRSSVCLAVDPELIDTVDRMNAGYQISDTRPSPVAPTPRLRDRWTSPSRNDNAEPGSSMVVAGEWIGKLRDAANRGCIVSLPWANADINGIAATGNPWLQRESVTMGAATIKRILGVSVASPVVIPPAGYLTPAAGDTVAVAGSRLTPEEAWDRKIDQQPPNSPTPSRAPDVLTDPHGASPGKQGDIANDPRTPVPVLLADTAPPVTTPGVQAHSYDGALASSLARMGKHPAITAYSDPTYRFDDELDSAVSRQASATAALRLAVQQHASDTLTARENDGHPPLLVLPPADISQADAAALLDTVHTLYQQHAVTPLSLPDYLAHSPAPEGTSSIVDPAAITDTEVLRAQQQANYVDEMTRLMVPDAHIALTPYAFAQPLRRDILRAFNRTGRTSETSYDSVTRRADAILNNNRNMLLQLRDAAELLPPGNVYTRSSSSSPLLIVARNGLPLPVDVHIGYEAAPGVSLGVPDHIHIPAKGSITVQLTADIPGGRDQETMEVYLLSPRDAVISDRVQISVQTRGRGLRTGMVGVLIAGFLVVLGVRVARSRVAGAGKPRKRLPFVRTSRVDTCSNDHPRLE